MRLNVKFHNDDKTLTASFDQYIGGSSPVEVPTKLSELENDVGYITENDLPEVPITSDDWSVTIDGKDFLNMSSGDSMAFSTRNSMSFYSESDMHISASNIEVSGDMQVQTPTNDNSAVNKKYVDDAVKNAGGGVTSWNDLEDKPFDEIPPLFDIQWDGNMDGHDTVEVGEGTHLVKVSDDVYTAEQVLGSTFHFSNGWNEVVSEDNMSTDMPGALIVAGAAVLVHSATDVIEGMGLPEGSLSNGVWFGNTVSEGYYVNRFVAPHGIQTIDEKYIPDTIARKSDIPDGGVTSWNDLEDKPVFAEVATSGSWNDLADKPFGEGVRVGWKEVANGYTSQTGSLTSFSVTSQLTLTPEKTYKIVVTEPMQNITRETIGVASKRTLPDYWDLYTIGTEDDAVRLTASTNREVIPAFTITLAEPIQSLMGVRVTIYEEILDVKTLDEKYIPDTIARKTDIPTIPSTDELVESVIASLPIYNGEVEEV